MRTYKEVFAELAEKTIFIIECDIKTFLIMIVNEESNINLILSKLEEFIKSLVKFY